MASISLKLDRRRANVRGQYPIQFLLSSKGKVTTIGVGINILPEHWNGEINKAVVPKCPNARAINESIETLFFRYTNTLRELDNAGKLAGKSVSEIKALLTEIKATSNEESLSDYFHRYADSRRTENSRLACLYTLKTIEAFDKSDLSFESITVIWPMASSAGTEALPIHWSVLCRADPPADPLRSLDRLEILRPVAAAVRRKHLHHLQVGVQPAALGLGLPARQQLVIPADIGGERAEGAPVPPGPLVVHRRHDAPDVLDVILAEHPSQLLPREGLCHRGDLREAFADPRLQHIDRLGHLGRFSPCNPLFRTYRVCVFFSSYFLTFFSCGRWLVGARSAVGRILVGSWPAGWSIGRFKRLIFFVITDRYDRIGAGRTDGQKIRFFKF